MFTFCKSTENLKGTYIITSSDLIFNLVAAAVTGGLRAGELHFFLDFEWDKHDI